MNKTCLTCQKSFYVTDDEVTFLEKVSPIVGEKKFRIPEPTNCPDCRLVLRTVQRNEQYFHKATSAMSGKEILSLYAPGTEHGGKYKVITHEEWWSDKWDPMEYGLDFDFSRPMFEQFHEMQLQVPRVNLVQLDNENSPYTTGTAYCKNCYLINCSENCEQCYYGKLMQTSRDCMDSAYVYDSELCYECFFVRRCYGCQYLSYSQSCTDCWFSDNLKGCSNCFLCTNLANKQYCFLNESVGKEEYEKRVKEFLSSPDGVERAQKMLEDLRKKRVYKYANVVSCENSTGDFLSNCKNCQECYEVNDSEDSKYVHVGVNVKDIMDCSNMYLKPELNYQVMGTIETYQVIFSTYVFHSSDVMYGQFCFNSDHLFGCAGLRKKKYCIFNKQYTKEEYEVLVPRIIEHMVSTGEWGAFFPKETAPFGYNETVAQQYVPFTKEEALNRGFCWKDPDAREFLPATYTVPAMISDVPDSVVKETLACVRCGKNYKIISQELGRLRDIGLPLPKKCFDCRHSERMALRNSPKLWSRKCDQCGVMVSSTFAPDRPEKVYCEKCYLEEVY